LPGVQGDAPLGQKNDRRDARGGGFGIGAYESGADGYAQYCRNVSGRTVCNPATASDGTRAYEHWDNGAPAQASGSASTYRYRPDASALGRPNTLYSFGK
jgi:hypothetical protein